MSIKEVTKITGKEPSKKKETKSVLNKNEKNPEIVKLKRKKNVNYNERIKK